MKPHVKWTLVVGVVLMLTALGIYVLTNDEQVVPGVTPTTLPPPNP